MGQRDQQVRAHDPAIERSRLIGLSREHSVGAYRCIRCIRCSRVHSAKAAVEPGRWKYESSRWTSRFMHTTLPQPTQVFALLGGHLREVILMRLYCYLGLDAARVASVASCAASVRRGVPVWGWARATRSSCGGGAGPRSAAPVRVTRKGWYTPRHVALWSPAGVARRGKEARQPNAAPTRGCNRQEVPHSKQRCDG